MFTDIYLRADTEAELKAALPWAVDDGDWVLASPDHALDLIGPVMTADAVMGEPDPETGEPVIETPPVFDTGFHANLRCIGGFAPEIPAELIVRPKHPRRVWA